MFRATLLSALMASAARGASLREQQQQLAAALDTDMMDLQVEEELVEVEVQVEKPRYFNAFKVSQSVS
jgi:hypothetical protein